ncbi:pac motif [Lucifera butyrica]|uniref:histidine kinase n=1 Tax=Lucifera butyrica TaxID=1351585 RepID=A0A498R793_9FIRM|nr:PAS domain S-box protein [Lucifera butyrica]VBB07079.1 pac motif [Lucifera butyrica]
MPAMHNHPEATAPGPKEHFVMLYHAALAIMNRMNIDDLLPAVMEHAASAYNARDGFIDLLDEEKEALITRFGTGKYQQLIGTTRNFTQGASGEVYRTGAACAVRSNTIAANNEPPLVIAVPLAANQKIIGVLGVELPGESSQPAPGLDWLEHLSRLASIALDNSYHYSMVEKELMVRKWVEAAFQVSEERYKTLVDNIGVGITLINRDMEMTSVNKQLQKWLPHIEAQLRPKCYRMFANAATICDNCPVTKTFETGSINEKIHTMLVGGQTRFFRIVAWPVIHKNGFVGEVIEMVEDITERRKTEEQLLKLSRAVEQTSSSVIIVDTDNCIEYVNKTFSQITGYTPSEITGKKVSILRSELTPAAVYQSIRPAIIAGNEWHGELHNRKKNGESYWVSISASPIRNNENEITHYVSIQEDITLRKQMEEELTIKNKRLEEALAELERTQVRLVQQEKLAGIGHLAAGVAHEINNPLGFVLSNFATLMKYLDRIGDVLTSYHECKTFMSQSQDPEIQQWIRKLEDLEQAKKLGVILADMPELIKESNDGLERVGNIVKELRAFSRVDQQNNFDAYDLNGGLESTLLMARNEIKYNAEVVKELGNLPLIQAVGGSVNQVLLNILVNAAQAIKAKQQSGMGRIRVKTYHDTAYVYCEIEDSGAGIPADHLNKIFNPFFTTKPVGQGTGLGLSISYDIIVNKHHGDITVQSVLGEGTTFTVKLPIAQ